MRTSQIVKSLKQVLHILYLQEFNLTGNQVLSELLFKLSKTAIKTESKLQLTYSLTLA